MTRILLERTCRGLALFALAAALWLSIRAANPSPTLPRRVVLSLPDSVVTDTGNAGVRALRPMVQHGSADTTQFVFDVLPSAAMGAALGAVQAAGIPVQWVDRTGAGGLAASASRGAEPGAPLTVRASAGGIGAGSIVLRDAGGMLDSAARAGRTTSWQLASVSPPLVVQQGASTARVVVPDSASAKRVLVMAQPGWEGKFVVAALEESGWLVDGSMRVSPSGAVRIGAPQRLDVQRYAAVVVLDSIAVDASSLQAFVREGGGVVLGGDALQIPALSALRPARTTVLRGAIAGGLLTDDPRRGLEAWELAVTPGTVVLQEDRSDHGHPEPALVARRSGRGRVVAMPYRETWRWRMQGTDNGAGEHRRWWQSALAAAIEPELRTAGAGRDVRDALPGAAAPYADLVARLGSAQQVSTPAGQTSIVPTGDERRARGDIPRVLSAPVLLLFTLLALLAEWASRRLRGMR